VRVTSPAWRPSGEAPACPTCDRSATLNDHFERDQRPPLFAGHDRRRMVAEEPAVRLGLLDFRVHKLQSSGIAMWSMERWRRSCPASQRGWRHDPAIQIRHHVATGDKVRGARRAALPRPKALLRQSLDPARGVREDGPGPIGHANAAETLDTYSHLWPDSDDRTREAVDQVLARVLADSLRTEALS
jgi:hypothetical protein